ncbi:hypothetical protein ACNF49_28760 [Actinomadura sp. ATCC 39365]
MRSRIGSAGAWSTVDTSISSRSGWTILVITMAGPGAGTVTALHQPALYLAAARRFPSEFDEVVHDLRRCATCWHCWCS